MVSIERFAVINSDCQYRAGSISRLAVSGNNSSKTVECIDACCQ